MDLLTSLKMHNQPFGGAWVEQTRLDIGADLMGVLAVDEHSHDDFL